MKRIAAFGQKPGDLGGFREHNPARLYVRERFRALLRKLGEAEDRVVKISLDLGVGQWCAEVAREESVGYVAVVRDGMDAKWNAAQKRALFDLQVLAESREETGTIPIEDWMVRDLTTVAPGEDRPFGEPVAFVGLASTDVDSAGRVPSALRRLRGSDVPVVLVTPDVLPPSYLALAAVEEVRGVVPSNLEAVAALAVAELDRLLAEEKLPPTVELRTKLRRRQLDELGGLLRSLSERA